MEHLDLVSIDLPYKLQLVRAPRSTKIIGFQFEVNENGHNVDYSRIDYLIMMINKQNGLKNTEYDEWFLKSTKLRFLLKTKMSIESTLQK
jgi:hypothetical protein